MGWEAVYDYGTKVWKKLEVGDPNAFSKSSLRLFGASCIQRLFLVWGGGLTVLSRE